MGNNNNNVRLLIQAAAGVYVGYLGIDILKDEAVWRSGRIIIPIIAILFIIFAIVIVVNALRVFLKKSQNAIIGDGSLEYPDEKVAAETETESETKELEYAEADTVNETAAEETAFDDRD